MIDGTSVSIRRPPSPRIDMRASFGCEHIACNVISQCISILWILLKHIKIGTCLV